MSEQTEMFGQKIAPKNYRQLCEPFESMETLETQVSAFWEEFYELRNKYKIPDALVMLRLSVLDGDDEGTHIVKLYAGNSVHAEGMAAFAYGVCSDEHKHEISKALAAKVRKSKQ